MEKIIIAAMARNRVIGRDNKLPWHIPEELRLFKETTMGYPMIMGRRTFDSLGTPLPGRRHIILSRNAAYEPLGGERASSLEEALSLCAEAEKTFIIGGAQIFHLAIPLTDTLLLTLLEREVVGDVFFPEFSEHDFVLSHEQSHQGGSEPFTVATYRRKI
jgi:dihydrofolate reductase